jgi:hypothetical protein
MAGGHLLDLLTVSAETPTEWPTTEPPMQSQVEFKAGGSDQPLERRH